LERLQDAGTFREQTPYGPDIHTPKLGDYFDEHYGDPYLELSTAGVMAWLADVVVDLTEDVCRAGKPVTAEDWGRHLKDLGQGLLQAWLVTMAEETPMLLRPLVNRAEFQRRHLVHLQNRIATRIAFLAPLVPSPASPGRASGSGLGSAAAAAERIPVPISEPGADVAIKTAPSANMPAARKPRRARTKRILRKKIRTRGDTRAVDGAQLQHYRKLAGLTQPQLADLAGADLSTIARPEQKPWRWMLHIFGEVAKALNKAAPGTLSVTAEDLQVRPSPSWENNPKRAQNKPNKAPTRH
jgi:hypothetical protein